MPFGFALFILPPVAGVILGTVLAFSRTLRFLSIYAVCVPLLGTLGGWAGIAFGASSALYRNYMYGLSQSWLAENIPLLSFAAGFAVGAIVGVLVGLGFNQLAHLARNP